MVTRRSLLGAAGSSGLLLASGCLEFARGEQVEFEASLATVEDDTVEQEGFDHLGNEELKLERDVNPPVGDERTIKVYNWLAKYGKPVDLSQLDVQAVQKVAEENDETETDALENPSIDLETLEENGISEAALRQEGIEESELEDGSVDLETLEENGIDLETLEQYGIDTEELQQQATGSGQDGSGDGGGETIAAGTEKNGVLFGLVSTPKAEVAGRDLNPVSDLEHEELLKRFGDQIRDEGVNDIELVEESTETVFGESVPLSIFETTKKLQGMEVDLRIYVLTKAHEGDNVIGVGTHPKFMEAEESIRTLMQNVDHPIEQSKDGGSGGDSTDGES